MTARLRVDLGDPIFDVLGTDPKPEPMGPIPEPDALDGLDLMLGTPDPLLAVEDDLAPRPVVKRPRPERKRLGDDWRGPGFFRYRPWPG